MERNEIEEAFLKRIRADGKRIGAHLSEETEGSAESSAEMREGEELVDVLDHRDHEEVHGGQRNNTKLELDWKK